MSGHWALVPLKILANAKQRLADTLDAGQRQALVLAMAEDVLTALGACPTIDEILLISRAPEAAQLAQRPGVTVFAESATANLAGALREGVAAALAGGAHTVSMIPADVPAVSAQELIHSSAGHSRSALGAGGRVTLAPDQRCEGTNLLTVSPPDLIAPIFDGRSFRPHLQAACAIGASVQVLRCPGLSLDIDTAQDLKALRAMPGAQAARALLGPAAG